MCMHVHAYERGVGVGGCEREKVCVCVCVDVCVCVCACLITLHKAEIFSLFFHIISLFGSCSCSTSKIYSSSKVKKFFKTMHRCSSFTSDASTKGLQVADQSISIYCPISSTHVQDNTENAWKTCRVSVKITGFAQTAFQQHS